MKTIEAEEGMVFKRGEEILGSRLYLPDNFDEATLEQIPAPIKESEHE